MKFSKKVFSASFRASVPVLMGYITMGAAAGVLLVKKTGLGVFWAFITSATSISGALQFLQVDMFCQQTPLLTAAAITLCINLRYALYGIPMLERWRNISLPLKLFLILVLTDETFALQVENKTPEGEDSLTYCFLIAALNYVYWVFGVVLGGVAGHLIQFNARGIDFTMTALFIVILLDQLSNKANRLPAFIGFVCTGTCLLVFSQNFLIPSIILILFAIVVLRRKLEGKMEQ